MSKYLLISGSPKNGNTEYVLKELFDRLDGKKELILLREKKIDPCLGCVGCRQSGKCVLKDDMDEIYEKLKEAEILIIGTPNYFDNMSGILKVFLDRTDSLYQVKALSGKKLYCIVVGGGKTINSERVVTSLTYYADHQRMEVIGSHCFQALNKNELNDNSDTLETVDEIAKQLV